MPRMIEKFWLLAVWILLSFPAHAGDWWQPDPLSMPARPQAGSESFQNPPLFSWPLAKPGETYEVSFSGSGLSEMLRTADNWLFLKAPLKEGQYRWKVRVLASSSGTASQWSDERSFSIRNTDAFVVPEPSTLWSRAAKMPHPRAFPHDGELATLKAELSSGKSQEWTGLKARMRTKIGALLPAEPQQAFDKITGTEQRVQAISDLRNQLLVDQEELQLLGLLWLVDRDTAWRDEAKRRVLHFAKWSPRGSSGLQSHNQATRMVLLMLALGYDRLHGEWSAAERQLILNAIHARFTDLQAAIVTSGTLKNNPHNAWASYTLGYLVAVAPLLAGESPDLKEAFDSAFRLYVAIFPAWSGDDGGYGNGTAYGVWDVPESIVLWDALRWATGFDIYRKPAIRNFGRFMAYFLPPGSPEGLFGDGADVRMAPSIARYAKSFSSRAPSSLMDWYAAQLFGEERATFTMLTSPVRAGASRLFPKNTANSAVFKSVGWAALHGDLADRSRLSVYFKSSPFGSLNHSHADQNSFVIHARGEVIAMDSGVYDYYNSPHWREWYKQTRAHNAITFDEGKGQLLGEGGVGSKAHNGIIERFASTPTHDLVSGEAAAAYGKDVISAKRWVVLVRPDTVVVIDKIRATQAKSWEWNYHASTDGRQKNGVLQLTFQGSQVCVRVTSPSHLGYTISSGYQPPPVTKNQIREHYWHRYSYATPSAEGVFVSIIKVDCKDDIPEVQWNGRNASLKVGGKQIRLMDSDVLVE